MIGREREIKSLKGSILTKILKANPSRSRSNGFMSPVSSDDLLDRLFLLCQMNVFLLIPQVLGTSLRQTRRFLEVGSVIRSPFGFQDLPVKKGVARLDDVGGKVRNFFGCCQPAPGRSVRDPLDHFGRQVGSPFVRCEENLDSHDDIFPMFAAPFIEQSVEGTDPGSGREIGVGLVMRQRGEEENDGGVRF